MPRYRLSSNDGCIEIDISAAERALRAVAPGRKNYLFCGSDGGGESAAAIYTLLGTTRLNGVDPERWLYEVLTASRTTRLTGSKNCCPGTWLPKSLDLISEVSTIKVVHTKWSVRRSRRAPGC